MRGLRIHNPNDNCLSDTGTRHRCANDEESSRPGFFIPAKLSDIAKAKVSKQQAIAKAQESGAPIQEATAVFTALGYLSNPILEKNAANGENVDPALLGHPLVWIISYEGVEIPSSGPPGASHGIAH